MADNHDKLTDGEASAEVEKTASDTAISPSPSVESTQRDDNGRFVKGHESVAGNRGGIPNKVNAHTKELIQAFVEHGMEGAQAVYDRLVAKQPRAALTVLSRFTEYAAPKLARTEVVGEDGGPVIIEKRIHDSSDKDKDKE